jgi:hypothetical protein
LDIGPNQGSIVTTFNDAIATSDAQTDAQTDVLSVSFSIKMPVRNTIAGEIRFIEYL